MKLVPMGANVIVRRLEEEETTAGGIVLPDVARNGRNGTQEGRVLSVGDGRLLPNGARVKHQVLEGDRIFFSRYAGTEVTVDDEKLLILSEDDILAVVP